MLNSYNLPPVRRRCGESFGSFIIRVFSVSVRKHTCKDEQFEVFCLTLISSSSFNRLDEVEIRDKLDRLFTALHHFCGGKESELYKIKTPPTRYEKLKELVYVLAVGSTNSGHSSPWETNKYARAIFAECAEEGEHIIPGI